MYTQASALKAAFAMRMIAFILLAIAIMVLIAWHDVQRVTGIYLSLRTMAYSTALCFLLSGVALLALSWRCLFTLRTAALFIVAIAVIRLAEIYWFSGLAVNRKMMLLVTDIPPAPVPMAATTAFSFVLTGTILFLLGTQTPRARTMMVILVMSVVAVTTAVIALLAHTIGHLPAFEWLGLKMPIPTAVAFILLVSALLTHSYPSLKAAFKQLSFLGHSVVAEKVAANINTTGRMEERMRQIIEAAPNGIVMINDVGMIEIVNRQAEKIFGYDRSELLGQPIENLIPKNVAHQHPHHRADFFSNPVPRAMGGGRDLFALRKDGKEFPVEIGLAPITTDEGMKVLASVVDITERKKSAQLLLAHQRDLEKSNRELARIIKELEAFAYVASHDLKSPLRGVAQLSNWIDEDLLAQEYDNVSDHTKLLRSRIMRMEKLLDDMLIFYRAGKIDNSQKVVDVKRMAIELFDMQNLKPGLRLEVEGELPIFMTLAIPFEQVLRNLFSNAIKHHDKDEGLIRVACREQNSDYFEFSVCDDGPGIPEQYQQRIFGMFQTLKPRDELEGSGMGLALIKKIIENYSGEINVHSTGRGTCFTFTWPKKWSVANV